MRGLCMKRAAWLAALIALFSPVSYAKPPQKSDQPPSWAYGFATPPGASTNAQPAPAAQSSKDDGLLKHLPGSGLSFTVTKIRDSFGPADWYPADHPQMPPIVAHGRQPNIRACALCHYPNGKGRPENAPVAGLPYEYFLQTISDFRNGKRKSTDTRKANTNQMIEFAESMTDEEIKAAAQYFSSLKYSQWIRVVETNIVPKTEIASDGMFLTLPGNAKGPIGDCIIETPENVEATEELRNPHSSFIAYVPVGSVKRGEALVMHGGGGKTTQCTICHGYDLQGLGPVPGIAGRSPSYVVRQLYDIRSGSRAGLWTNLMKPVVAGLSTDDMVAIAAYLASRPVPTTGSAAARESVIGPGKVAQKSN